MLLRNWHAGGGIQHVTMAPGASFDIADAGKSIKLSDCTVSTADALKIVVHRDGTSEVRK